MPVEAKRFGQPDETVTFERGRPTPLVRKGAKKYVAAAYGIVFVTVLFYVVIIAAKLARLERETAELAELARAKHDSRG